MEITYIGHSCFKIKGKTLSLVIDPYDPKKTGYKLPKLDADAVLVTHDHEDHNFTQGVSDFKMLINTAGEYETEDVFINGIEVYHDEKDGSERGRNVMYLLELEGVSILHCGDLGHPLAKETLERIPNVDILLVPVGGTYTIDGETAVDVISELEPGIVIPMHYQTDDLKGITGLEPLEKFLDEMGADGKARKESKLKISSKSDIPEDTTVVVLEPQH